MDVEFDIIRSDRENPTQFSREDVVEFLHEHLDRYRDSREAIGACISYACGDGPGQDGFILLAHSGGEIVGCTVLNDTNMTGYIPEHILVYIAVDAARRGQGLGKALMQRVIDEAEGAIALHVEPDNPARHLYEAFGFSSKYLEMRRSKQAGTS